MMGTKAQELRRMTRRKVRATRLSDDEKAHLRRNAGYEGSPYHKRNPGDFGLVPPSVPRPDKTLCDEAGVRSKQEALRLFALAVEQGLVSEATTHGDYPKELWVVDEHGRVFEGMYGGSRDGRYHGYPIRRSDPLHQRIRELIETREDAAD